MSGEVPAMLSAAANPKQRRQRAILELVARLPIASQEELVERLRERQFEVTQATVSRDIAELGLVKVPRGERHIYVAPENVVAGDAYDARLRRLLEDIPVRTGRSGLTLVLTATPGSAGAIAQAIDQSSLSDQVGTLAGDNTLLVLFEDEPSLERWMAKFEQLQPAESDTWRPTSRRQPAASNGSGAAGSGAGSSGAGGSAAIGSAATNGFARPIAQPVPEPVGGGTDPRPLTHSEAPR